MIIECSPLHDQFWRAAKRKVEEFAMVDSKDSPIFGDGDNFHVYPTMSLSEIQQIEKKKSITLPDEFKSYLMHYGAGGAGPPAYNVINLRKAFARTTFDKPFVYKAHYSEDGIEDFSGLMYIGEDGCGTEFFIELKGQSVGQIYCNWGSVGADSSSGNIRDFYESWLDHTSSVIIRRQHELIQKLGTLTKAHNKHYTAEEYNNARAKIIKSNSTLFECRNCHYPVDYNRLTASSFISVLGVPVIIGSAGHYLYDSLWFYPAGFVIIIMVLAFISDEITSRPPSHCPACGAILTKPLKKIF